MKRNYERMKCRSLLKFAPRSKSAWNELSKRACSWTTCAVGEAVNRLNTYTDVLLDNDELRNLGFDFMDQVGDRKFSEARKTYNKIDRLAKAL